MVLEPEQWCFSFSMWEGIFPFKIIYFLLMDFSEQLTKSADSQFVRGVRSKLKHFFFFSGH